MKIKEIKVFKSKGLVFAKNMNGWSDKSKIWCSEQSGRAEKNTRK